MQRADDAIVVTGASSGIGAAAAETLARAGFAVYAGVRRDADATAVTALHPNIRPLFIDVTDSAAVAGAAQIVAASGRPLRGLINNAGIALGGPLEFLPLEELRRQFEVNVFGPVGVTQAFLPQLRAAHGRLAFVGSVSGVLAVPFLAPYSASKFALRAIADALRVELAPWQISVSLIEPASVKTPIWRKGSDSRQRLLEHLGPQAAQYYKEELEALFSMTAREERDAMPVSRVSRALLHAMTARRPRAHYTIGSALARFFSIFPPAAHDRVMRASFKRP